MKKLFMFDGSQWHIYPESAAQAMLRDGRLLPDTVLAEMAARGLELKDGYGRCGGVSVLATSTYCCITGLTSRPIIWFLGLRSELMVEWPETRFSIVERLPIDDDTLVGGLDPEILYLCIPRGIKVIGSEALAEHENLEVVHTPRTLTRIEAGAFRDCRKLRSIHIRRGVRVIGPDAFRGCVELLAVQIDGDPRIAPSAFQDCPNVVIYSDTCTRSVRSGSRHVPVCTSKDLSWSATDMSLTSGSTLIHGPVAGKHFEIPAHICHIGARAFAGNGYLRTVRDSEVEQPLSLGEEAFYDCWNLHTVEFNRELSILDRAFQRCISLKHVEFPDSLQRLPDGTFLGCQSLREVSGPKIRGIGAYCFCESGLRSASFPECHSVGPDAFAGCGSLKEVHLPSVTELGDAAFMCADQLTKVELSDSIVQFPKYLFYGCEQLIRLDLPERLQRIDKGAFWDCKHLALRIPQGVQLVRDSYVDCPNISREET